MKIAGETAINNGLLKLLKTWKTIFFNFKRLTKFTFDHPIYTINIKTTINVKSQVWWKRRGRWLVRQSLYESKPKEILYESVFGTK